MRVRLTTIQKRPLNEGLSQFYLRDVSCAGPSSVRNPHGHCGCDWNQARDTTVFGPGNSPSIPAWKRRSFPCIVQTWKAMSQRTRESDSRVSDSNSRIQPRHLLSEGTRRIKNPNINPPRNSRTRSKVRAFRAALRRCVFRHRCWWGEGIMVSSLSGESVLLNGWWWKFA